MKLSERFENWVEWEVGSTAIPAMHQHLRDHGYRLFSYMVHDSRWSYEVYHPLRGIFRATGATSQDALLAILRQVWLVEGATAAPTPDL